MSFIYFLLLAVGVNLASFLIAYWRKSDKFTDFSYGATFFILALISFLHQGKTTSKWILFLLVGLWAIRLSSFLLIRIIKNKRDKRFDGVRENFVKFGAFWVGQGVVAWVIMLSPLIIFKSNANDLTWLAVFGVLVAVTGWAVEATADLQKFKFSHNSVNKNKFIKSGLWKYSRHPNYFGEIVFWLGIYIFGLSYFTGWQFLFAALSPITIGYLLVFVTGLPKLEKYADKKWGSQADYKAYKKHTSVLVPLLKTH